MKKSILAFLLLLPMMVQAQKLNPYVSQAVDACLTIQKNFANTQALAQANKELKALKPAYWGALSVRRHDTLSADHHYIYDPTFIDSLVANVAVYRYAQTFLREINRRGDTSPSSDTRILTRNVMIGAQDSVVVTFASKGETSLAVVGEPKALITLFVKVTDSKGTRSYYNDSEKVNEGLPFRTRVLPLDKERRQSVRVTIKNTTDHDINVVVITNK